MQATTAESLAKAFMIIVENLNQTWFEQEEPQTIH